MGHQPAADHLDLWRGIDDAVCREALRVAPAVPVWAARQAADPRREDRPNVERTPKPAMPRVPEPA
jgi:hypothetical protein